MKLLFILPLLISVNLLVETEAMTFGWLPPPPQKKRVWRPRPRPQPRPQPQPQPQKQAEPRKQEKIHSDDSQEKIHSIRGFVRHTGSGRYIQVDRRDPARVGLNPGRSNKAYLIFYKESGRIYAPHEKQWLFQDKYSSPNVQGRYRAKPWYEKTFNEGQKFTWDSNPQGDFQIKNKQKGMCIHPVPSLKYIRPGDRCILRYSRDCGPKSYMFSFEEKTEKTENVPSGRKRRSNFYGHSKRKASFHGHSKRRASFRDHDVLSGSA